jgi:hypothetical protein
MNEISHFGHGRLVTLCPKQQQQQSCQKKRFQLRNSSFLWLFTREYTQCTTGSTFCFVFVVVVVGEPLIKLASRPTVDQT